MTEYEAADRNAELIEEMAEDIEIAQRAAWFDMVFFRR
jgi:hypothetical protein